MRIMILSVTAGFGHHATAKAVSDQLEAMGATVETFDIYAYINRAIKETIDKGYLFTSKHTQELYRLAYTLAENNSSNYLTAPPITTVRAINRLGASKFLRTIREFNPDVIVCTHIFAAQLIDVLKRKKHLGVPTIGIVTDYTLHPYWENVPRIEYIVTASELLQYRSVKKGIAAERILPFGIPIHPKFNAPLPREQAAEQLGIDPDRPTILMMGGSMGYSDNSNLIASLERINLPLQLLIVCGRNEKQYQEMCALAKKTKGTGNCTLIPYGFVHNVEVMMSAADCIITKPGGLTVSESLAKHLPMVLVNPIPGHEERNVEFLLNNGMALLVTKTFPVDEALYYLFHNPVRIANMRRTMEAIAHPDATERLCQFILDLGEYTQKDSDIPDDLVLEEDDESDSSPA